MAFVTISANKMEFVSKKNSAMKWKRLSKNWHVHVEH